MNNFKFKTLFKTISEQIDLPDNAVIADLGCRDAGFLLEFQRAFSDKIKSLKQILNKSIKIHIFYIYHIQ